MDINDAITMAQVQLNELTRFDQRYCIIHKNIREHEYGWLIPWANKEVVTQGGEALTIGGNWPFFVDKRTGKIYRYRFIYDGDFEEWCRKLPTALG